jgi:predicted DCC family thiol-disulfide oxidoreductase YuxK
MTAPAPVQHPPELGTDLLYYDGGCGLCHWWVRFILARDLSGTLFRYAPLDGPTFAAQYPEAERARLPDSVVVRTADGRTLVRSAAAIHIGERLGGPWRILARVVSLLPGWLLDAGYNGIARVRYRLFSRPADACPLVPPELRTRFLP